MEATFVSTTESVWIPVTRNLEVHEDIILRILQFTTIERFLIVGGGNADDIYNRIMEVAYRKGSKLVLNIMIELKNQATQNLLKSSQNICWLSGLFGLHDNIFDKKIQGDKWFDLLGTLSICRTFLTCQTTVKSFDKSGKKELSTSLNPCT